MVLSDVVRQQHHQRDERLQQQLLHLRGEETPRRAARVRQHWHCE
jgi:hypothetical protein